MEHDRQELGRALRECGIREKDLLKVMKRAVWLPKFLLSPGKNSLRNTSVFSVCVEPDVESVEESISLCETHVPVFNIPDSLYSLDCTVRDAQRLNNALKSLDFSKFSVKVWEKRNGKQDIDFSVRICADCFLDDHYISFSKDFQRDLEILNDVIVEERANATVEGLVGILDRIQSDVRSSHLQREEAILKHIARAKSELRKS